MKKFLVAVALLFLASQPASATLVLTSNLAGATEANATTFIATFNVVNFTTYQQLQFTVQNTTAPSVGGFLTGLAFNLPGAPAAQLGGVIPAAGTNTSLGYSINVSAPPFGTLGYGFYAGGSWTGGGNPNNGIGVGQTGNFFLSFSGTSLTEQQFAQSFANNGFVARFRGLENGGSNKVPGIAASAVPEPSTIATALGLVAVSLFTRKRISNAPYRQSA